MCCQPFAVVVKGRRSMWCDQNSGGKCRTSPGMFSLNVCHVGTTVLAHHTVPKGRSEQWQYSWGAWVQDTKWMGQPGPGRLKPCHTHNLGLPEAEPYPDQQRWRMSWMSMARGMATVWLLVVTPKELILTVKSSATSMKRIGSIVLSLPTTNRKLLGLPKRGAASSSRLGRILLDQCGE